MKKCIASIALLMLTAFSVLEAQQVLTGTVKNKQTKEGIPAVSVTVNGTQDGGYTNDKGNFRITTSKSFPLTISVSTIGYAKKEILVSTANQVMAIELEPVSTLGQEVVVSASRFTQKKLESPVTIERIGSKDIINSPQPNYFDMIQGLKGVDVTTSSFVFTTITTRGFNTSGNSNFTQIVDGMDNQAPGLNFSLGSVIGLSQLDVDNVELLSGASSALYGSRGLNGTLISTGKDPFKYQGLSFQITQGVSHIKKGVSNDPLGPSPVYDWAVRWGKKVNDHLAFKVNFQYTQAKDWIATDTTNTRGPGNSYTDPNYNGVNLYGGATSVDINPFLMGALQANPSLAPIIEPLLAQANPVARTGYTEYNYLDSDARLFKGNAEIRYKINSRLEAIGSGTFGTGNAVYSNDTRYQLKDFQLGQYRLELKSDHWFLRGYTTQENSGKTVVAGYTAQLINEAWKPSYDANTGDGWYPQYTGALLYGLATGSSYTDASFGARQFADQGRPAPGSAQLYKMRDSISQYPSNMGGTQFLDRSKLYNFEGQYNFSSIIKFVDLIAGMNYRVYSLNSKGTLFPDADGPISVKEYSAYAQLSKKLLNNRLTLGASLRWDKNSLFEKPQLTSRLSAVVEADKNNFIRLSYQNAYSFPNNIQTLQSTLQGTSPQYYSSGGSSYLLNDVYHFDQYPAYTYTSVQDYQNSGDINKLEKINLQDIKPQSVNAFELGYSSLIAKKILVDVLGYYSTWKNFIGYTNVANTPGTTDVNAFNDPNKYAIYNISYNNSYTVNTYGYAIGIGADLSSNFLIKGNFTSDYFKNRDSSQVNNFNTPNYKFNIEFGNTGFGPKQRFSFGTTFRYKPAFFYQVGFGSGTVPASAVFDAMVSYKLIEARSFIKLGATNLTNKYYRNGFGNPAIGGMYFVTYAYNVF
ncbi:TonB-dependent receptor [Flavihumibacter profundi]|uniref:TonB-dependent receptor n=1 Tax=Flavihumibacter profundi TaxID=2716883 RepID=UPI001CC5E8A2|nr:carboxypeptidase-like regulatory domain-containing protein [Flavihumibacter profundi]MBZ5855745.1 TonB-dependent receptor [Flavihumibacter profundi]